MLFLVSVFNFKNYQSETLGVCNSLDIATRFGAAWIKENHWEWFDDEMTADQLVERFNEKHNNLSVEIVEVPLIENA